MKTKSENFDDLKFFCTATLSIYCLVFALFALGAITQCFGDGLLMQLSEILENIAVPLLIFSGTLSPIWLLITVIWCGVICKQEHSIKYFFKPIIIINILLSLIFPQIMMSGG